MALPCCCPRPGPAPHCSFFFASCAKKLLHDSYARRTTVCAFLDRGKESKEYPRVWSSRRNAALPSGDSSSSKCMDNREVLHPPSLSAPPLPLPLRRQSHRTPLEQAILEPLET
eukprot:6180620-Pleurochrysis_carterae.AAC.1